MPRIATVAVALLLATTAAIAQRPSDPALLIPETAPELDYVVSPTSVTLPAGTTMGATAAVAFDSNGHLWVLARGATAFFEFDAGGNYLRSFGQGMFTRAHGLRIDRDNNLWATDVGHWWFDEGQTLPWRVAGLPLEEIGFFVVIPLVSVLTLEGVRAARRGVRPGVARRRQEAR